MGWGAVIPAEDGRTQPAAARGEGPENDVSPRSPASANRGNAGLDDLVGWPMSKNGKTAKVLLGLTVAGAGVVGAWTLASVLDGRAEADAAKHAVNQIWIERLPTDGRDMIGHFVLVEHPRMRIGGIGKSSQWRHFIEAFVWKLQGSKLSVYFPQEEARAELKVKSWRCEGEAPSPFQLCLEISNGRRTAHFYSRDDWKVDPHNAAASLQEIAEDSPELAGLVEDIDVIDVEGVDLESFTEVETIPGT
jgi:hypothetical protein